MKHQTPRRVRVLLVEDNKADAGYIRRQLHMAEQTNFEIDHVEWVSTAITAITNGHYDVVLLDLSLHDSQGVDTVVRVREASSRIPIIVMTGSDDLTTAIQCVNYDAQDYIVKSEVEARHLERSILQAIMRAKRRRDSRRFLRASLEHYTSPDDATTLTMLRGHAETVHDFYSKLMDYLRRDARSHLDNIEAIASSTGFEQAVGDMLGIIDSAQSSHKRKTVPPRRIKDEAEITLTGLKPAKGPNDETEARAAIADALEELSDE